jgi:hypothetical protein
MNKNEFYICLTILIVLIYIIDKLYLSNKKNENFDALSDNTNDTINNIKIGDDETIDENKNNELTQSENIDSIGTQVEDDTKKDSETKPKPKSKTDLETNSEANTESNYDFKNSIIIIIVVVGIAFCCLSIIMNLYGESNKFRPLILETSEIPNFYSIPPQLSQLPQLPQLPLYPPFQPPFPSPHHPHLIPYPYLYKNPYPYLYSSEYK